VTIVALRAEMAHLQRCENRVRRAFRRSSGQCGAAAKVPSTATKVGNGICRCS